jgi:hypothetical protein
MHIIERIALPTTRADRPSIDTVVLTWEERQQGLPVDRPKLPSTSVSATLGHRHP